MKKVSSLICLHLCGVPRIFGALGLLIIELSMLVRQQAVHVSFDRNVC